MELNSFVRNEWDLKARHEDDGITMEIVSILAKKELSVDRASKILEDAWSMLPRLAKIPYSKESK